MAAGSCAMGFGTCCIFTTSNCGDSVDQNCTYVRNDGFPSSITGQSTCSYTIKKCDPRMFNALCDLYVEINYTHVYFRSQRSAPSDWISSNSICWLARIPWMPMATVKTNSPCQECVSFFVLTRWKGNIYILIYMQLSTGSSVVPTICGSNAGQHSKFYF